MPRRGGLPVRGCSGSVALSTSEGLILVKLSVQNTTEKARQHTPLSLNVQRRHRKTRALCRSSQKPTARWGWKRMHEPGGQK